MKKLILSVVSAVASAAWAYLPPVEEKSGVRVEIESFPQKIEKPSGSPYKWPLGVTHVAAAKTGATVRAFPVTLSNATARAVAGRLAVWLNDDWDVTGPAGQLTLAAGEVRRLDFTATAKPRALSALYPVHARFTPDGVPDASAPHPIAIFQFDHPHAPRTVRRVAGPNPKRNGADSAGPKCSTACAAQALEAARRALRDGTDAAAGRWRLADEDDETGEEAYGAGVAWGPHGLVDGALAFTDGKRQVVFSGFTASVAGTRDGRTPEPRAEIRAEKGTLRIRWSLGVKPDEYGEPRLSDLAVGPASERPARLYAGFGSVFENPRRITLAANGFELSTRHMGVDYTNGLSVVQAVDVVPDRLVCDGARNVCSLHAHHDATFTFVPSARGAFAAARRFRAVAGYRKSPGLDALGSRMCLDQWGGAYRTAAKDLAKAAKYGLRDAIFIRHVWQRWGYDYRLPEIYPPAEDPEGFFLMRRACRDAGILFSPHDNYTDIYPDADGYSYDLVVFNLDGTPQKAWFNPGRHARSYRWAPHAFHPWALRNAKLLKGGCAPDAIFIDVLTAHGPFDYLDRAGRFHSKNETSASWAKGFAMYREGYGNPHAVCVSEAGQDHLVGVADAGECDHFAPARWAAPQQYDDAERTPWHDIVTHGYYVLFAGGLGNRYAAESWEKSGDVKRHGYASDDYLSNCVIGGRNPMCDGPFSRRAVMTYWLQHDVCAALGREEFLALRYEDGDIHRQHAFFGKHGEVWVNRGEKPWTLPNKITLPRYGYFAKTDMAMSGIAEENGVRRAFAVTYERGTGKGTFFFDARPPVARPANFGPVVTDGAFRFVGGDTIIPLPESAPFTVTFDAAAFGWTKERTVIGVEAVEPAADAKPPRWTQKDGKVTIEVDARAFAYRIRFRTFANPVIAEDWPDPTIWNDGKGTYYSVATGLHKLYTSRDLVTWTSTGESPITEEARRKLYEISRNVWAPCVVKVGNTWNLYISLFVSDPVCKIAVLTSSSPNGPFAYRGVVVDSVREKVQNAIDPFVLEAEGKLLLFFGSLADGVHVVELTADGLALAPGAKPRHVAGIRMPPSKMRGAYEGSYVMKRGDWWYLFVSGGHYGDHSYYLTVGRSKDVMGPYFDRAGNPLTAGLAKPILASGPGEFFYGPGHNGDVFTAADGRMYMFYHSHCRDYPKWARPTLLQELKWTPDGWPFFDGDRPVREAVAPDIR